MLSYFMGLVRGIGFNNGQYNFIGVHDTIEVDNFPGFADVQFLMVDECDITDVGQIFWPEIQIVDMDGRGLLEKPYSKAFSSGESPQGYMIGKMFMHVTFKNVPFDKPGDYFMHVKCLNQVVPMRFFVRQRTSEPHLPNIVAQDSV